MNRQISPLRRVMTGTLLVAGLTGLAGCDDKQSAAPAPAPPSVVVTQVTSETVPLVREFVGTTQAVKTVEIRAKVEGYLLERRFTEGTNVKKDDVLFMIDPKPFQADLDQAKADLTQKQASLRFANEQVKRYEPLVKKNDVSKQQFDGIKTQAHTAAAAVKASQAAVTNAELNLGYTTVTAPIDGRVGETLINIGNLVSAENTLLTNMVQLDPIYVYFAPSEAQYLELESYQAKGPLQYAMVLADQSVHGHPGTLDFVANQVDQDTGTLKLRAVFPNPEMKRRPGQYVQVRVQLADQADTILVPAPSIVESEAGFSVFVVGKDDKLEQRKIELGEIYKTWRVVKSGLKAGETVVVKGVQKVHDGQQVKVEQAPKQTSQSDGTTSQ